MTKTDGYVDSRSFFPHATTVPHVKARKPPALAVIGNRRVVSALTTEQRPATIRQRLATTATPFISDSLRT